MRVAEYEREVQSLGLQYVDAREGSLAHKLYGLGERDHGHVILGGRVADHDHAASHHDLLLAVQHEERGAEAQDHLVGQVLLKE